ncbi:hypothetical protein ACKFKF_30890 [Phormidesmis sp. 146-12]
MNFLDISNADRLRHYPSGHCPLCVSRNFRNYISFDEGVPVEQGLECATCGEKYPTETTIVSIGTPHTHEN